MSPEVRAFLSQHWPDKLAELEKMPESLSVNLEFNMRLDKFEDCVLVETIETKDGFN